MLTSPASSRCGRTLSPTGTRRRVSRRDAVALAREESNSGDGNPDSCRLLDVVRQIGRVGYHRGEKHQAARKRSNFQNARWASNVLTRESKGMGRERIAIRTGCSNDVLKLRSFADDLGEKRSGRTGRHRKSVIQSGMNSVRGGLRVANRDGMDNSRAARPRWRLRCCGDVVEEAEGNGTGGDAS